MRGSRGVGGSVWFALVLLAVSLGLIGFVLMSLVRWLAADVSRADLPTNRTLTGSNGVS